MALRTDSRKDQGNDALGKLASAIIWAIAVLLLAGWPGVSDAAPGAAPGAAEVADWSDELFRDALDDKRLSGAVVIAVQDGDVVFAHGYGYADLEAGTPVDPESTQFRIGSITKTFTATAIAQLLKDGRIASLDDPANKYLERQSIGSRGEHELTLRELLTHSAGFESRAFNIATDAAAILPLSPHEIGPFTAKPVNEPGRYSSYNNYGTAVLGLIVEDVSGEPFDDYLSRHIFEPLGMRDTEVGLALEAGPHLGVPYAFLPNGQAIPIRHRTVHPFFAPAGGINATAADMAKYMNAQLLAHPGGQPAFDPDSVHLMHRQYRSNHPLSTGFGMLFFTWNWNGHPVVLHGGDWPGTHSGLLLFPESGTGLFFSLLAEYPEIPILESITGSPRTTPDDSVVVKPPLSNVGVIYSYLERFHGTFREPDVPGAVTGSPDEYLGSYVAQAGARSTMERLTSVISSYAVVSVTPADDGKGILVNGAGPYTPIGPDVFWRADLKVPLDAGFLDSPLVNFVRDDHGRIDYLTPQIGFDVWRKAGPLENPRTYSMAFGIGFLVLLTAAATLFYPNVTARPLAKWLPAILLVLVAAMPVVLFAGRTDGNTAINDLFFGYRSRFAGLAVLANLATACALYLAWHTWRAWREHYWQGNRFGTTLRVHYSLLGAAALLLIPAFVFFRLAGI